MGSYHGDWLEFLKEKGQRGIIKKSFKKAMFEKEESLIRNEKFKLDLEFEYIDEIILAQLTGEKW